MAAQLRKLKRSAGERAPLATLERGEAGASVRREHERRRLIREVQVTEARSVIGHVLAARRAPDEWERELLDGFDERGRSTNGRPVGAEIDVEETS